MNLSTPAEVPSHPGGCRIRVLTELLVKKIAAGEVVERPASVVKELVENAVDAAADRIALTIEDGGRQLIQVTDNGWGMTEEELRLAVLPHATSKITSEDDLYSINTLGFRGEALASVSAVSRLRIVSRPPNAAAGCEIRVTGDELEFCRAAGSPPGTTVEVRDLFFNVPARRKFLRAGATETGHINEQFARMALAHPAIGFVLTNNRRLTQSMPAGESRLERIGRFYGPDLAAALLHIERHERNVHLEAYVAPPAHSRATPQWQYTFVNGRYIRDRYLQHALKEAYRGLMESNRHGVVFLFLSVDPKAIDVNVHPTKIEVRWADSNLIHSQVLSALRESFQRADLRPALRTDRAALPLKPSDPLQQDRLRQEWAAAMKAEAPIRPGDPRAMERANLPISMPQSLPRPHGDPLEVWRTLYGDPAGERNVAPSGSSPATIESGARDSGLRLSIQHSEGSPRSNECTELRPSPIRPRAVQMHDLYLVVEEADGITIVDQHALHERVMYEELRRRLAEGRLESQRLLLPETLNVTPRQAAALAGRADLLARLGIEVTAFGTDSVAVHAFPSLMKDTQVLPFMRDLIDRLENTPESSGDFSESVEGSRAAGPGKPLAELSAGPTTETIIHRILDMMACKAAVKAGDRLTPEEIDALITQRHLINKAASCPHGRPTMLRLTKADLERQFRRT